MSVLPKETIKIIAECVGISNLSDEISNQLASDVEYRIREIVQESIKFMKHSKREYLSTDDINDALKLRNIEVLYGYSNCEPHKFSKVQSPTQAIYYIHDRELNFQDIISQPLPKCPREPSIAAHWLAIEGVQPLIPQNPSAAVIAAAHKASSSSSSSSSSTNNSNDQSTKKMKLDDQSQPQSQQPTNTAESTTFTGDTAIVKPQVKHVLAKEMQMFYEKVVSSVNDLPNHTLFEGVVESLRTDSSLNQLLPYFTNFISLQVTQNLTNLELLMRLMRMCRAILESTHLHAELYLHQMMPSMMTCLLGRKLCQSANENHWKLRDYVADILVLVCKKYGDSYGSLQGRITRTLLQALHDTSKSLPTHYGAIVALSALEPELNNPSNQTKSLEVDRVVNALIKSIGKYLSWLSQGENVLTILDINKDTIPKQFDSISITQTLQNHHIFKEIFDIFGEKILVFIKEI
ncbi:TATA-binding protein-associated-factor [Cavenderia fasciculata]|uniref:TATA-binding protein-associated-factor n=1 Tax=Cavenderia fasciculata TaxID=261658 RepID=F4PR27_CACFS|nr:TATA-binding protein-associated-factor [Cavenderia fasciculata]EGG22084.1 TATA-binding protein-associated-factor [Cavenderia fasciculata]|eukprot:XP_004359935.1 TATA-binding protein-associated-factor [Cavenderia fasciculata]